MGWCHRWWLFWCPGKRSSQPHPVCCWEVHPQQPLQSHLSVPVLRQIRLGHPVVRHHDQWNRLQNVEARPIQQMQPSTVKNSVSLTCSHRTAFCCWIVANILFSMPVILYAGFMMVTTAAFIFFSLASFSTIYNIPQCSFSVGTESFEPEYSHSFWLALATGMYPVSCIVF